MAILLRMESISIKQWHGVAKVLGSVTSLSGALVFALVKGPPLKIMNWFPEIVHHQIHQKPHYSGEWIKGSLIMLSANTAWSLWLIWQIRVSNNKDTRGTTYVVYEDIYDAKTAVDHLCGSNVANQYLIVLYYPQAKMGKKFDSKKDYEIARMQEKYGVSTKDK